MQTGHVSPQFRVVFDDRFETVESLREGTEPVRWNWLASHKREHHLNDRKEIIHIAKIRTGAALGSSTLLEVPKENDNHATTDSSSSENMSSIPLESQINKNKHEVINPEIAINSGTDVNRSHDILPSNGSNSTVQPLAD